MEAHSARMPILGPLATAGLLAGALIGLFIVGPMPTALAVCIALFGALLWLMPTRAFWLGACFFGFGYAALHVASVQTSWLPSALEGKPLPVQGRVLDLPVQEDGRRSFMFLVAEDAQTPALRGKVIRLGWYGKPGESLPEVQAGSRWSFTVKLKRPHGLRNPGSLDAERNAFANRVVATGSVVGKRRLEQIAAGEGINAVRDALGLAIADIDHPAAKFIRALAVGDTRAIEEADWRILRANGLTHLIAISGSHVSMAAFLGVALGGLLWRLCPALGLLLPRKVAAPLCGAGVAIGYTMLAGGEVPTVRTLLMMWCVVGALLLRRRLGLVTALSAAVIALVVVDPLNLLRPGFWLSFMGVAWLAWCLQGVKQNFVKEMLSAQGIATLGLLPLCVLFFGQTSWVAPLANIIAVPLWGLVIVPLSIAGVALNVFAPALAHAAWWMAAALFDMAWPVFVHMAQWPGAQINIAEATPWAVALASIGALWLLMPRGVPLRLLSFGLWMPLIAPAIPRAEPDGFIVTFIDVGQGLSVLVQTRTHTMLYDAGPKGQVAFGRDEKSTAGFDAGEKVVVPALHALGVKSLDLMMLSHGDADHAGGAAAVDAALHPKDIQAPHGTPVPHSAECQRGDRWTWDQVHFEVLAPVPNMAYAGNASSCVLKISSRYGSVLLTGDVEAEGEAGMIAHDRAALRADVVSMPHHGSNTSSTYPFVRAVAARYVVASSGYRNLFKHPRERVWTRWIDAGTQPVNTPASGAVGFAFTREGIEMRDERSRRRRVWDPMEGDGVNGGSGLSYGQRGSPIPPYPR